MSSKKSIILRFEPDGVKAEFEKGITILDALREIGLSIRSECGGRGICGKCKVIIQDQSSISGIVEKDRVLSIPELESNYRLACSTMAIADSTITIPNESRMAIRKILVEGTERQVTVNSAIRKVYIELPEPSLSDIRSDVQRLIDSLKDIYGIETTGIDYPLLKKLPQILHDSNWRVTLTVWDDKEIIAVEAGDTTDIAYGVAVDIGTSKIISYLSNLTTGELVSTGFLENPQVRYGEDIISRISYASKGEEALEELHRLLIDGVNTVIYEACRTSESRPEHIYDITVVGNTAMHHIFLGIQPIRLASSPYVPAVNDSVKIKARDLALKTNPGANVHVLPVIAGFVGADAVADIISTGIYESNKLSLMVDIGTNTEVMLGDKHGILACSCASGPAFEGAHIKCGMKAVTGAIERLKITPEDYEVEYQTIGNAKPIGLCGSAMIDAVADLLRRRIIDRNGRFNISTSTPKLRNLNQEKEFLLVSKSENNATRDIVITQRDIREIQLAKAAIYTGCSILMKRKKIKSEDIKKFYVAGSFGNYLNLENAKLIGMIPDIPKEHIAFVGNAAGAGARMALISKKHRRMVALIPKKVQYVELALDADFQKEFVSAMYFPHGDSARFPLAKKDFREV
jgi:uncharacterized 2Fe-2S/4Fe-4S cluster protein (DUF4445 family)